jgi:hypothetical protein
LARTSFPSGLVGASGAILTVGCQTSGESTHKIKG